MSAVRELLELLIPAVSDACSRGRFELAEVSLENVPMVVVPWERTEAAHCPECRTALKIFEKNDENQIPTVSDACSRGRFGLAEVCLENIPMVVVP